MGFLHFLTASLFAVIANARVYNTTFSNVTWDDVNWRITTTYLDQGHYQSRMSLANGYLGINVAAAGPFFEVDSEVNGDNIGGWPLFERRQTFATIAGFYASEPNSNGTNFPWLLQYGGESVIAGIPHWAGLLVESQGHVLNASVPAEQISKFYSTLDMKRGLLTWQYTWSPPSGPSLDVRYRMMVHKLYINMAAVELRITPSADVNVTVIDVFDGDCAVRTEFDSNGYVQDTPQIWTAVRPHWINNVTAYVYSTLDPTGLDISTRARLSDSSLSGDNQSSIAQAATARLTEGKTTFITKFIGVASSEAFEDPKAVASNASEVAALAGFETLLKGNANEWSQVMPNDSVDNYTFPNNGTLGQDTHLVTLQVTAVTNPWNLIQNTVSSNAIRAAGNNTRLDIWSIPVGGLGSSAYAGWIFWDAEIWMAPGLVVTNPQAAKQIAKYRLQLFPQAQENIKDSYQGSTNDTTFTAGGAAFPWISGRYGNCTAAGPCFDYEYHLNGDIGLELFNYYVTTGDLEYFKTELFPIYDAIAYFYSELLTFNETNGKYVLYNATDPDEYANNVNNPAFTMALIQTHLETANTFRGRFGLEMNETWTTQAVNIYIPVNKDANIILEYQTMNGTISVKQADVVLVDDFLDYPNPYSLSDLDYYAGKQSLNGPGMTYGVYSIVANEISPSGCSAFTYDLYGSEPYIRAPWFQYSEQLVDDYQANGGTHPAYPFLTGMGGANRVAIFGYLGLRLFADTLNVDPNLPPQISYLKYRTFYWQGHPISAISNSTHTTLTRLPQALPNANSTFTKGDIPVTISLEMTKSYALPPNGTIVIDNRQIGLNKTVPGNLAQCHPVTSDQDYLPGQFPLAAVDGAISTKWQPALANDTSSIVVELPGPPFVPIVRFEFDWAQTPPASYAIAFSNSSFDGDSYKNVTSSNNIAVSIPYDAAAVAEITPYTSNTTSVTLNEPVWSGRFARLSITGAQTDVYAQFMNGTGATVAEWAIVAQDGTYPKMRLAKRKSRRATLKPEEWRYEGGFVGRAGI